MRTAALLLLASAVCADQIPAYGKRTYASADGRWMLVTEAAAGKLRFVLKNREGKVRGEGEIDHVPNAAAVFADGTGFVLWGRYGGAGRGLGVARYDYDGKRRWSHEFEKMFDEAERKAFPRTLSFVFWAEDVWIDGRRGLAIGTTANQSVRVFDMKDGKMRPGGMTIVLESLDLEPPPVDSIATAGRWFPDRAGKRLAAIAADESMPAAQRVAALRFAGKRDSAHAALLRAALGDPAAKGRVVEAAEACLPREAAREVLVRAALDEELAEAAAAALGRRDDLAGLVDVTAHGEAPPAAKRAAAAQLGNRPLKDVLPPVLAEFKDADVDSAVFMLNALIATGDKRLARAMQPHQRKLIAILGRRGADVAWLAECFTKYPTTEAAKPLLAAARKHPRERKAIFRALRACTGLKIGDDLSSWAQALR